MLIVAAGYSALWLAVNYGRAVEDAQRWVKLLDQVPRVSYYGLGAGLLLLAVAALISPLGRGGRHRLLEFPTDSGKVQVDITALESCLAHVVSEEEGVVRARVALRGGTGGGATPLGCTATIWFEAGPDIIGRVSEIQARMRAYYYHVLPIKEPVKIDIRTRLVYRKKTAEAIEESAKADRVTPSTRTVSPEEEDYSGPQYPSVGDGETGGGEPEV
jgi:hypothetical protein